MKIVMLCDFFNERLEYQENLLLKYYRKHGHDVTIITSTFDSVFDYYNDHHDPRWPARTYAHEGGRIIKLRYMFNLLNRIRPFTPIARILVDEAPDLIYVHDIVPNMLEAVRYKKRHPHVRMIFDYHADYSNSGHGWLSRSILHGVIRKWVLDRARPHLSRIFPIVPDSAKFLQDLYGVTESEMELLPLGADIDLVREIEATSTRESIRTRLGIPHDAFVVFTGGKFSALKRTELLIDAVRALADSGLHLLVAGDAGPEARHLKDVMLERAGGDPAIHFLGWQDKRSIYELMLASDIAVFPASQSIMWLQAVSTGLPMIIGDFGRQDVSYMNTHDNIVVLPLPRITTQDLVQEIRALRDDPERRLRMRSGALAVAAEQLDWNRLIERTLRFNSAAAPAA
jgi:1,2-diacylglycerol 3-alpha-glucosyltransferase